MDYKNTSAILQSLKNDAEDDKMGEILQEAIDKINQIDVSEMPELNQFEKRMVRDGKLVRAVKAYGDRNNCGLRKAKIICETYKNRLVKV